MLLGRCGEMCYLNKLLMVSVLGWLFQVRHTTQYYVFLFPASNTSYMAHILCLLVKIPVIPEDIFFTNEFTEVAKLEDGITNAAGLVSELSH